MKTSDEVVDAIRNDRVAHAKKFGFDLQRIAQDLKRIERTHGVRVIRSPALRRNKMPA
jgi:hypothetical protein